jgi:hypothetical protein
MTLTILVAFHDHSLLGRGHPWLFFSPLPGLKGERGQYRTAPRGDEGEEKCSAGAKARRYWGMRVQDNLESSENPRRWVDIPARTGLSAGTHLPGLRCARRVGAKAAMGEPALYGSSWKAFTHSPCARPSTPALSRGEREHGVGQDFETVDESGIEAAGERRGRDLGGRGREVRLKKQKPKWRVGRIRQGG